MYSLVCSSKGASSVAIATWVGVSQKTAWKMLHTLRALMDVHQNVLPMLQGVVELDEKYLGGKPRFQQGVKHKRGHGTAKACIATAVERKGAVKTHLVANTAGADLEPFVTSTVAPSAHLMSDEHHAYQVIGRSFSAHDCVCHSQREGRCRNRSVNQWFFVEQQAAGGSTGAVASPPARHPDRPGKKLAEG